MKKTESKKEEVEVINKDEPKKQESKDKLTLRDVAIRGMI